MYPENKVDQHAAMNQLEQILKRLTRNGLIEYIVHSCKIEKDGIWETSDRAQLTDMILKADYGVEAFKSYRAGGK